MASKIFLYALQEIIQADIDLETDDIRCMLNMTNNSGATPHSIVTDADDGTKTTVAGITTLAECDDTGGPDRQAFTTQTVALDDTNDRVEFSGDATEVFGNGNTFSGDASYDYDGSLIYKHVTNDSDSPPVAWIEFTTDVPLEATQVTITWNAEGIIQFAGP